MAELLPFQRRVIEERGRLVSSTQLLRSWLDSREPQHLTVDQRLLMELQHQTMALYAECLARRIALFGESE
jgi:hypothetical protein